MNLCCVQGKVSHDSTNHSLAVLREIASWGHSYLGSRIRILPTPHPRASFGGRHDMYRLESRSRPIHVRDGQPRRFGADLDHTRDTAGQFASSYLYATYRGVRIPTCRAERCQPCCSCSARTHSPVYTHARAKY